MNENLKAMSSRTRRRSLRKRTRIKWQSSDGQKRKSENEKVCPSNSICHIHISYLCDEEDEKKKNAKGVGTGMAHFYRKLLEESEQKHEETVAATESKPTIGPQGGPNLTITKPPDFTPKSDVELARLAREQGKDVELNDDNQIVDKRELLSAGLNLSMPNTRKTGLQLLNKKNDVEGQVDTHRAVGTAASRREINERRAREMQRQMEEEKERLRSEKEREEQESRDRTVARRNDETSVKSAKERYLERKRRRLEEASLAGEDGQANPP